MGIQCFFLHTEEGVVRRSLRRYRHSMDAECPIRNGIHDASVCIGDERSEPASLDGDAVQIPKADPRWPVKCACGYEFGPEDEWQDNRRKLYRRSDTGELTAIHEAPAGAMWFADWWLPRSAGPDGHCLVVKIPYRTDGSGTWDWMVDSRASNCTKPEDKEHRCWVRHGEPPNITVDKNGNTCAAGAGSIMPDGGWHGFLRNGVLIQA